MVVALFALSLVMVVGGIASIVQGFPYVRLESGLAMVIGGSTAASAGVILLGLSAVVMRLQRLETAFREEGGHLPRPIDPPHEAFAPLLSAAPMLPVAPALAGAAGLAGLTVGAAGLTAERREPDADAPAPSLDPSDSFAPSAQAEIEPPLPDLLPPGEPVVPASDRIDAQPEATLDAGPNPEPVSPGDDLFAAVEENEKREEWTPELPALRSSFVEDLKAEDAHRVDEGAAGALPEPPVETRAEDRQVVGTYASGGNTYVMFADGSIEAETPRGRFTFGSLEELKSFVEAGGENDARGAA